MRELSECISPPQAD